MHMQELEKAKLSKRLLVMQKRHDDAAKGQEGSWWEVKARSAFDKVKV